MSYVTDLKSKRATRRFEDVPLPTGGAVRVCSLTGLDLVSLSDVGKVDLMLHAFLMCWVDENGHRIVDVVTDEMVEDLRAWDAADLAIIFKTVEAFCLPKRGDIEKKS